MRSLAGRIAVGLALLAGCSSLPAVAVDGGCADASAACDGACVDLSLDPAHCGACGRRCPAETACAEGRCAPRVTQLSAAYRHVCALGETGAVWCWGASDEGEVGDGVEALYRDRPTRVPGLVATAVYAGYDNTCARLADETLSCWGRNSHGEVRSFLNPVLAPAPVPGVGGVVSVAVGSQFVCAALRDGTVRCWGDNEWGTLGATPPDSEPVMAVGLERVVQVVAGARHVCARQDDGAVWCWGQRGLGAAGDGLPVEALAIFPRPVPTRASPASALVAGESSACALTLGGAVECWGDNGRGEVGDGSSTRRWSAVEAIGGGVTALHGGFRTMLARVGDGELRGWGANRAGELGFVAAADQPGPARVLDGLAAEVTQLVAGEAFACALTRDGAVRCWGTSPYGATGLGRTGERVAAPTRVAW